MKKTNNNYGSILILKQSPLFALSKCSNELAHTNMWAWLMKIEDANGAHPFVKAFIDDYNDEKEVEVHREKLNMDLIVVLKNKKENTKKCYVIENKIKAIPTKAQLKAYQDKIKTKKEYGYFVSGILTGIEKPNNFNKNGIEKWYKNNSLNFKEYNDISNRIREINNRKKYIGKKINKQYINRYCDDIKAIYKIINEQINSFGNNYYWELKSDAPIDEIKELKLRDVILKREISRFGEYVEKRLNKDVSFQPYKGCWDGLHIEPSFNRTKPTLSIVFKKFDDNGGKKKVELAKIGVQIEANEFRIYGGTNNKKNIENLQQLNQLFCDCGFFEPFNRTTIDNKDTKMQGSKSANNNCNGYVPANYVHGYQYWNIDMYTKKDHIKYDKLYDFIKIKLIDAAKLIKNKRVEKLFL